MLGFYLNHKKDRQETLRVPPSYKEERYLQNFMEIWYQRADTTADEELIAEKLSNYTWRSNKLTFWVLAIWLWLLLDSKNS